MHPRRRLLALLAATFAVPILSALAQQKMPRIGLFWIKGEGNADRIGVLRVALRTRGYVDGQNIQLDDRFLVEDYGQLEGAAVRLVAAKPDVIVIYGATALLAARDATSSIPIVTVAAGDPLKLGVVTSLSKPGGNITGTTSLTEDLSGKRFQLLKELVPGARRIAVVLYAGSQSERVALANYEAAARELNLEVQSVEVRKKDEIVSIIGDIPKLNVNAIAFVGSTLFSANRKQIVAAVAKSGLPAIYVSTNFVEDGGLVSYGAAFGDLTRYAVGYIDKILKGAKPGELPIEQPAKFELAINKRAAKAIGIALPNSVLGRADRIIE